MAAVAHTLPTLPNSGTRHPPRLLSVPARPVATRRQASLYRRRRVIAVILVVSVVLAGFAGVRAAVGSWTPDPAVPASPAGGNGNGHAGNGHAGGSTGGGSTGGAGATHVVRSGDTLWSIAEAVAAGRDVRVVVKVLAEANGSAELRIGEAVQIPAELSP